MYSLPQSVLTHIYEYDPTYRVGEHQKQIQELKEQTLSYEYDNEWDSIDFMEESFTFQMYMATSIYVAFGIPVYLLICCARGFFMMVGMVFERFYRVYSIVSHKKLKWFFALF